MFRVELFQKCLKIIFQDFPQKDQITALLLIFPEGPFSVGGISSRIFLFFLQMIWGKNPLIFRFHKLNLTKNPLHDSVVLLPLA